MLFTSPIDTTFQLKKYDKFGVLRPLGVVPAPFHTIPHSGVDLRPHENGGNRSVYAIADGIITTSTDRAGQYYYIDHGSGWGSIYVHTTRRPLPVWSRVKQGQKIGDYCPGSPWNHLHLTIRKHGKNVNPENYIDFAQTTKDKIDSVAKQQTYTVQSGDTLGQIAIDHYGSYHRLHDIALLNDLADIDLIQAGQTLKMP